MTTSPFTDTFPNPSPVLRSPLSATDGGHRVRLRPLHLDDVPELVTTATDPATLHWTTVPHPYGHEHGAVFCTLPNDTTIRWAITTPVFGHDNADRYAGTIEFRYDRDASEGGVLTGNFGYMTAPWARGKGIMVDAVRAATEWLVKDQGFTRLEIRTAVGNEGSQRVATKAGYILEKTQDDGLTLRDGTRTALLTFIWPNAESAVST